jgi:hypothetical protein
VKTGIALIIFSLVAIQLAGVSISMRLGDINDTLTECIPYDGRRNEQ